MSSVMDPPERNQCSDLCLVHFNLQGEKAGQDIRIPGFDEYPDRGVIYALVADAGGLILRYDPLVPVVRLGGTR